MEQCSAKRKKRGIMHRVGAVLIFLGAACLVLLAVTDMIIRPTLMALLDYKCRVSAERIISDAVFDRFSESRDCDGIVSFTFDNDGRIAALSTDRAKINTLKALLNDAVNEGLDRLGDENVGISVGTLTGISFLYGTGDELVFSLEPKGKAETRLECSFESAGINQTVHSIILRVDAQISPMMTGFSETVDISYDILLAQTVIVGSVPESYSHIVLDEGSLSELANIDI